MRFTGAHKVTIAVALCARLSLTCIVTAALLSCVQPTVDKPPPPEVDNVVTIPDEPTNSPEIPVSSPAWQPDAGTLYLFYDEPGGELYHSETPTADRWASRVRAFRLTAESKGYVFVAGTPPEE